MVALYCHVMVIFHVRKIVSGSTKNIAGVLSVCQAWCQVQSTCLLARPLSDIQDFTADTFLRAYFYLSVEN